MAKFLFKSTKKVGLPPGTLVFVGEQKMENPFLRLMDYNLESLEEITIENIEDLMKYKNSSSVTWLNIDGVHEVKFIGKIGEVFNLSPMLLEDVMHTGIRPKIVEFENCIFISLKMLKFNDEEKTIEAEQLSVVIAHKFLITFQEVRGDVFEPVRDRIRKGRQRIRSSAPDFLAYSLLDVVCENYIHIIQMLGEKIDQLEEELISNPKKEILLQINRYKQEINYLRRAIRPVRDIVNQVSKTENSTIKPMSLEYWRELEGLAIQSNEGIDYYREILADQLNLYHTTMSTKMNDIMKVLTIFSAIFIPLTFIAGIYGTNFDVLPELHFEHSYFVMLGVMALVAVVMLIYFKKQRWF